MKAPMGMKGSAAGESIVDDGLTREQSFVETKRAQIADAHRVEDAE
jgi:hypothetical protein